MHRLTRLADRKMGQGKQLQAVLLLTLQKLLTPTPAMGVIVGALATMTIVPLVALRMVGSHPLLVALVIGVIIASCAGIFQKVHDKYWEKVK